MIVSYKWLKTYRNRYGDVPSRLDDHGVVFRLEIAGQTAATIESMLNKLGNHMKPQRDVPRFVIIITVLLGCYDLLRGFMHTILLHYSALHIAGLDLSTATASDQLRLLGAFGISNYETGIALIMMGLFARKLALAMLGIIPFLYLLGYFAIKANVSGFEASHANWGGAEPLMVYMGISSITFLLGLMVMFRKEH